jgi:hypothetical protein
MNVNVRNWFYCYAVCLIDDIDEDDESILHNTEW